MTETLVAIVGIAILVAVEAVSISHLRDDWDRRKVFRWLSANTRQEPGMTHVGTAVMARALGMSEERVREVCLSSPTIVRGGGTREEWAIATHGTK